MQIQLQINTSNKTNLRFFNCRLDPHARLRLLSISCIYMCNLIFIYLFIYFIYLFIFYDVFSSSCFLRTRHTFPNPLTLLISTAVKHVTMRSLCRLRFDRYKGSVMRSYKYLYITLRYDVLFIVRALSFPRSLSTNIH